MIEMYLSRGKVHAEAMTEKVYRAVLGAPAPAIIRNAYGQPIFADAANGHLSLSHSGDYTLLALSDSPVGIDLQRLRMKTDPLSVAKRFLSPAETARIKAVSPKERKRIFLEIWAKKEAAVKAVGLGFTVSPSSFSVLTDRLDIAGLTLKLFAVDVPAGYTAWLASPAEMVSVGSPVTIG